MIVNVGAERRGGVGLHGPLYKFAMSSLDEESGKTLFQLMNPVREVWNLL